MRYLTLIGGKDFVVDFTFIFNPFTLDTAGYRSVPYPGVMFGGG